MNCKQCRTTYKELYNETPKCEGCFPEILVENILVYDVYCRMFGSIENQNIFTIMDLTGINKIDQLFCLDLINITRSEVLRHRK